MYCVTLYEPQVLAHITRGAPKRERRSQTSSMWIHECGAAWWPTTKRVRQLTRCEIMAPRARATARQCKRDSGTEISKSCCTWCPDSEGACGLALSCRAGQASHGVL